METRTEERPNPFAQRDPGDPEDWPIDSRVVIPELEDGAA